MYVFYVSSAARSHIYRCMISVPVGGSGIWLKDEQASDMKGYERSLTHCFKMSGFQKETAMRLFEGMEVQQAGDEISIRYLTVVPFFQVCLLVQAVMHTVGSAWSGRYLSDPRP